MIDVIMESIRNIDLINALEDKVRLLFRHKLEKVFKEEIAQARQQDPDQLMAYYIMVLKMKDKIKSEIRLFDILLFGIGTVYILMVSGFLGYLVLDYFLGSK